MQTNEANLLADRLAVNIRWLSLLGLTMYLAWGKSFDTDALILLIFSILWNILLIVFIQLHRRLPYHTYFVIAGDTILALGIFLLAGDATTQMVGWAGLMPVVTAAWYFGITGGLIAAGSMAVLMTGILFVNLAPATYVLDVLLFPIISFFLIGAGGGYLSGEYARQIRGRLSETYTERRKAARLGRDRMSAIYAITTSLTATLDYRRVLDMALSIAQTALSENEETSAGLVAAFFLLDDGRLKLGSALGFLHGDLKAMLPGQSGMIPNVLHSGNPTLIENPESDPELRRIVAFHSCHAVYCYPLRTAKEPYGILLFGHPFPNYFSDVRLEVLEIVGKQSLVAIQNAELYRELLSEKERMMEVQAEAQKKLARDLHDGPTQSVAALAMRVNFARRLLDRDIKAAGEELFKIEDLARRTTKEIRHMLFTLRPLVLESSGLVAALQAMADKMDETFEQKVIVQADQSVIDELEMGKQGVIFYIAEEAVNNARKHAEAQTVWVRLKSTDHQDVVLLEIQDDGVGFDVGAVDAGYENRGSLGMVNMRERAQMLNGRMQLQSALGKGTRIRIYVPLNEDAALKLRQSRTAVG